MTLKTPYATDPYNRVSPACFTSPHIYIFCSNGIIVKSVKSTSWLHTTARSGMIHSSLCDPLTGCVYHSVSASMLNNWKISIYHMTQCNNADEAMQTNHRRIDCCRWLDVGLNSMGLYVITFSTAHSTENPNNTQTICATINKLSVYTSRIIHQQADDQHYLQMRLQTCLSRDGTVVRAQCLTILI